MNISARVGAAGRIALPGIEEMSRKMRDTAGETPALPFEETAGLFAVQNTERDAPWTDWSKMLQLHEEATSSSIHDPQSTIPPLLSHSCSFAFIRGMNISARVGAASPYRGGPFGERSLPKKKVVCSFSSTSMFNVHPPITLPLRIPWQSWRLRGNSFFRELKWSCFDKGRAPAYPSACEH